MNKRILYLFILCLQLLLNGCRQESVLPDLRESFSETDTRPFGGNIAFRVINNSFEKTGVSILKTSFLGGLPALADSASVYFCFARNFYTQAGEVEAMLDYVQRGNTFFLAASEIDSLLLNRIYCKVKKESISVPYSYRETSISLVEDAGFQKDTFRYFYRPFTAFFSELNENYSRVIGYNSNAEPNCIVFFWGKGKLFLHTDPRAFSNYFLLKHNNINYLQGLLQLLEPSPHNIYWNSYYSRQSGPVSHAAFSTVREIMKYPPFAMAFWLALALLFLFVIFGGKRKQRIIPANTPNVNSSVAFTETIARLYLQEKNNKNIADKMITYFYEFIRSNYFLYSNVGSEAFIKALSRKSAVSLEDTVSLFSAINHATRSEQLDDYQLLSLNEQIQQFYKKRK